MPGQIVKPNGSARCQSACKNQNYALFETRSQVLLLTVRNNLARRFPQLIKRLFDLMVSFSALVLGLPVLLWIALKLKVLDSGRPVFYGHERIGQHNKSFPYYKFRTIAPNGDQLLADLLARDALAKAEWDRDFKLKNDARTHPDRLFSAQDQPGRTVLCQELVAIQRYRLSLQDSESHLPQEWCLLTFLVGRTRLGAARPAMAILARNRHRARASAVRQREQECSGPRAGVVQTT